MCNTSNLCQKYSGTVLEFYRYWALSWYKDHLFWYRDSHYIDKTVMQLSHLYNRNPYTEKTASGGFQIFDICHINTLRLRQNGRHFPDDIFKCIFLNENVWISIKISLRIVPKGPINNIPALVQIMAWRLDGAKPLSEPMMVRLLMHICVTQPQWVKERPDYEWYCRNLIRLYIKTHIKIEYRSLIGCCKRDISIACAVLRQHNFYINLSVWYHPTYITISL